MALDIYNDGTYAARHPDWHAEDSDWKAGHLFSLLSPPCLAAMVGHRVTVVEVGCGYGGVVAAFCKRLESQGIPCDGAGYDISEDAVAGAAKRHPEIRFAPGEWRAGVDPCDIGLMVDVLEHAAEPIRLLEQAKAGFRHTLFHIPLDENCWGKVLRPGRYYQYLREDRGHIHCFTRASAFRLLEAAGLVIERWKYTHWGIELYKPGGGRSVPIVRLCRAAGRHFWPDLSVRLFGGASLAVLARPRSEQP